jgi:hypothetical protein
MMSRQSMAFLRTPFNRAGAHIPLIHGWPKPAGRPSAKRLTTPG